MFSARSADYFFYDFSQVVMNKNVLFYSLQHQKRIKLVFRGCFYHSRLKRHPSEWMAMPSLYTGPSQ